MGLAIEKELIKANIFSWFTNRSHRQTDSLYSSVTHTVYSMYICSYTRLLPAILEQREDRLVLFTGKYESRLAKGMKLIRAGKVGIGLDSIHT
jgi:hypothetical protein